MILSLALFLLGSAAPPPQDHPHRENGARDMARSLGAGLDDKALAAAIAKAESHSLGSAENPIRENSPAGEEAYLGRLRCADGAGPGFTRGGNVGIGPFGYIVDRYKVTCPGKAAIDVYMDMYHDGPEDRPVPGFTLS